MRHAECHSDRKYYAKELCKQCYYYKHRAEHAIGDRKTVASGMTQRRHKHPNLRYTKNGNSVWNALICGHPVGGPRISYCMRCIIENNVCSGPLNPKWNGGRYSKGNGYIYVRVNKKPMMEHRAIAERVLGRPLKPTEVVHHINMIKTDNRNENLLICDRKYHRWLECQYARGFAELKWGKLQP